ncbi:MAG TPA: hypothetical protein VNN73_20830 [Blastocatellia bacterium]|nr:hypothetical protein [Blastocatellia bacterium]
MTKKAMFKLLLITSMTVALVAIAPSFYGYDQNRQLGDDSNRVRRQHTKREFVEIKLDNQATFRLYVGEEPKTRVQGIVPIRSAATETYLRIKPKKVEDTILIETSVAIGHISSIEWCKQIDELPNYPLSIDVLKQGESKRFGPTDSSGLQPFKVTIRFGDESVISTLDDSIPIEEQDPSGRPTGPPPGCCSCGTLTCCPNPGKCIGCGNCGQCCRS